MNKKGSRIPSLLAPMHISGNFFPHLNLIHFLKCIRTGTYLLFRLSTYGLAELQIEGDGNCQVSPFYLIGKWFWHFGFLWMFWNELCNFACTCFSVVVWKVWLDLLDSFEPLQISCFVTQIIISMSESRLSSRYCSVTSIAFGSSQLNVVSARCFRIDQRCSYQLSGHLDRKISLFGQSRSF